jgi:hypothetical protein
MTRVTNMFTICFLILFFSTNANRSFLRNKEVVQLSGVEAYCYLNANGTVFNLNPLHRVTDYELGTVGKVYLNFCGDSSVSCTTNKTSMVTYMDDTRCIDMSGNETVVSDWQVFSKIVLILR